MLAALIYCLRGPSHAPSAAHSPSCAKFHTRGCRIILLTCSNEHGGCCPRSAPECTDEGAMFALSVQVCVHIPAWYVMGRERKSCMFELVGKFSPFSTSSAKMKRSVRGEVWDISHPVSVGGRGLRRSKTMSKRWKWLPASVTSFFSPNNNPKEKGSFLWKFLSRWTLLSGNTFSFDRKVGPTAPWTAATARKGAIASWQSKKGKTYCSHRSIGHPGRRWKKCLPCFSSLQSCSLCVAGFVCL